MGEGSGIVGPIVARAELAKDFIQLWPNCIGRIGKGTVKVVYDDFQKMVRVVACDELGEVEQPKKDLAPQL